MAHSPLHDAAAAGDLGRVRALLDAGADVNEEWTFEDVVDRCTVFDTTRTPLWLAIQGGHDDVASLLLDRGARVDAWDGYDRQTPFTLAAARGLPRVVARIVARGPTPDEIDAALVQACSHAAPEETEVARLLLDAGGRSPEALWHAAHRGRTELAALLVARGVAFERPGVAGLNGSSLLAAISGGQLAMFEWLVAQGADEARVLDEALWLAAHRGDLPAVEAMIRRGADLDARGSWGWTALVTAASAGHAAIVEALLACGADPSLADDSGKTAREWASTEAIARLLAASS